MANTGPHSAHSQFYVTLRALPSFDCKTVAFGRLIDGSRVLEFIGALDTKMDRPLGKVTVCSCGKLAAVELGDYDQQAAVVRLVRVRVMVRVRVRARVRVRVSPNLTRTLTLTRCACRRCSGAG